MINITLYTTLNNLCGYIAMWVVRQSPYAAPDNLEKVIIEFAAKAQKYKFVEISVLGIDMISAERDDLKELLETELLTIPEVLNWNERKNGNKSPFGVCSMYDKPSPDNDFIDLDALVMNIIRSVHEEELKAWCEYNNFEKNQKKWVNKLRNWWYNHITCKLPSTLPVSNPTTPENL